MLVRLRPGLSNHEAFEHFGTRGQGARQTTTRRYCSIITSSSSEAFVGFFAFFIPFFFFIDFIDFFALFLKESPLASFFFFFEARLPFPFIDFFALFLKESPLASFFFFLFEPCLPVSIFFAFFTFFFAFFTFFFAFLTFFFILISLGPFRLGLVLLVFFLEENPFRERLFFIDFDTPC